MNPIELASSGDTENAPIIITAMMGAEDQSFFNKLRTAYFPPERNYLDAHITLFHHLPPTHWPEIKRYIIAISREYEAPFARTDRLLNLGRGVAFHVDSPELIAVRSMIADNFATLLIPQDKAKPRLHITVQNKVSGAIAKQTLEILTAEFEAFDLEIIGIAAFYYKGGPWQKIGHWRFAG